MTNRIRNTTEEMATPGGAACMLLEAMTGRGADGMIERSEAAGQAQLLASEVLPADMQRERPSFERLGFVFGGVIDGDPLFIYATLPRGWTKRGTDHAMHSVILDEKGRERVSVFYKAAFYDRRASMTLTPRYIDGAKYRPGSFFETESAWVIDNATGKRVFETSDTKGYDACRAWIRERCGDYDQRDVAAEWAGA